MATITIPSGANYAAMDDIITNNPDRTFVIEMDNGVMWGSASEVREEFDDLAPGESFTIHAVCDTVAEAEAARHAVKMHTDDDVMAAMWNADPSVPDAEKFHVEAER